jgi:hypothetical protein
MDSQIIDAVSEWDTVTVDDGFEGLHGLAGDQFSGAVSTGMTWAFLLNGRVIGVFEGGIDDFDGASLTAYRAPDRSLPLLFAMRATGGETRAKYYTNETPLSEADSTLSAGGFTGYVELSENVLSGDYYVVYHGGKSMSAAFVGANSRLVTGEEAFEMADDEVGIYEVNEVAIDVVDLPERPDEEGSDAAAAPDDVDDSDPETGEAEAESDDEGETPDESRPKEDDSGRVNAGSEPDDARADPDDAGSESDDAPTADPGPETPGAETEAGPAEAGPAAGRRRSEGATPVEGPTEATPDGPRGPDRRESEADAPESGDDAGQKDVFSAEEKWREARSIPSLDPSESSTNGADDEASDRSSTSSRSRSDAAGARGGRTTQKTRTGGSGSAAKGPSAHPRTRESATTSRSGDSSGRGGSSPGTGSQSGETVDRTVAQRLKEKLDAAKSRHEELRAERDELESERDRYRDRVDELESEVEALEAEVERLRTELEAASGGFVAEESMSAANALAGTNLFVRYERKGEATLERAHDGQATRQEVNDNLKLEHHTTFDTEGLAVDGEPYEEFLHASTEYGFAKWVVTDLLYEIGETGNRTALSNLFDAIPDIDRVELKGVASVETEEGVEEREFDVIFRDQMGDPLFVADMNTSRNAATEAMVGSLVGNARTIAEGDESMVTGFYVTESFFDPGALETVSERTSGGFLSRSKKKSFVKLSRKRGFHLCLVEARNGEFHVNVPDL